MQLKVMASEYKDRLLYSVAVDIHCQGSQKYLAAGKKKKSLSASLSWQGTLRWYSSHSLERDDKHQLQQ